VLTVLLCARDAERTLPAVLEAHERLLPPDGGVLFVAVDNGSRDRTRALLERARDRLPLVVVSEPRAGLNRARNAAWPSVRGDLVVLADADTVPSPGWLRTLRREADRRPEFAVFSGPIRPVFATPPHADLLAAARPGPTWGASLRNEDGETDPLEAIGPALALRTSALPAAPVFDESIGPDGTATFAMGAETSLLLALRRRGARAWFSLGAAVEHRLPPAASRENWVLWRQIRYGRGRMRLGTVAGARRRLRWNGVPVALLLSLRARRRGLARATAAGDSPEALRERVRLCYLAGQAIEARAQARGAEPSLAEVLRALPADVARRLAAPAPASSDRESARATP
jgi:glycosyltransferase involved in cell wall biosynthesis